MVVVGPSPALGHGGGEKEKVEEEDEEGDHAGRTTSTRAVVFGPTTPAHAQQEEAVGDGCPIHQLGSSAAVEEVEVLLWMDTGERVMVCVCGCVCFAAL